ncbi:acyltransferase [Lentzea sp. NBRC 105346]|uniref:acyltransferase family protein n=1 Tax=Lentzea sp. NBRC 105346 TaxID=3032205 RepID=UPI0024A5A7C7|nr:acyltransferase [Lentzea sp. NBRC 105346]GLZ35480.1 acyltransferase [Lentzea sp. NBRC 105346]
MSSLTHADYLALRRFPALDGLRAFAAVMVVFFHYGGPDWLQGWIGVQMFFVLSGFLITTLMLREERRTGRISLPEFYLRRAFRILPVYFVLLAVTVAGSLAGLFHDNGVGKALPYYLTFLNEFAPGNAYAQSWSLGVEQKFYLVWPLLVVLVGVVAIKRRLSVAALGMIVAAALAGFTLTHPNGGWPMHYFSILTGCALALVMHSSRGFALLRPLTNPVVSVIVSIGFVGLHLAVKPICGFLGSFGTIPGHVLVIPVYSAGMFLLLPALIANGPVQKFLSMRPLQFVGERSYSLYLVQTISATAIALAVPELSGIFQAITVTALGLVLASLLYKTVEVPMISYGRQVIARRRVRHQQQASPSPQPPSRLATIGQAQP